MVILYTDMKTQKVPRIVDISIIKDWIEVYWIIRRVKYTSFYWLIKEDWILGYLWYGNEVLCGVDFLRKGDFGTWFFLRSRLWSTHCCFPKKTAISTQNDPPNKHYVDYWKNTIRSVKLIYSSFGEKSMWCNMSIT